MGTYNLPDMYALICLICMPISGKSRVPMCSLRAEGIHIRQIKSAYVTTNM